MTFEELSTARYTQRSYDSKPVENDKIQKMLQAGRVAPTAKNNQPQKVYVVQSPAAMDKLRALTPCHYNVPLAMIICYDKIKNGITRLMRLLLRGWKMRPLLQRT